MLTQEQRRRYAASIFVVGSVLIALILWWFFRKQPVVAPEINTPVASQPLKETPVVSPKPNAVAPTPVVAQAQVVARDFTERFATYSSDAPYANYEDSAALATTAFAAGLKRSALAATEYTGVTARALSVSIEKGTEADGAMSFAVQVQKEQFRKDRSKPQVSYATAQVDVVRENGVWKVHGFAWR